MDRKERNSYARLGVKRSRGRTRGSRWRCDCQQGSDSLFFLACGEGANLTRQGELGPTSQTLFDDNMWADRLCIFFAKMSSGRRRRWHGPQTMTLFAVSVQVVVEANCFLVRDPQITSGAFQKPRRLNERCWQREWESGHPCVSMISGMYWKKVEGRKQEFADIRGKGDQRAVSRFRFVLQVAVLVALTLLLLLL